jgi:CheY-like chemotaxis protein
MGEKKLVFIVDDDKDFLEVIKDVLEHPRFRIETYLALNGYRAIDEVIKQKPDVLFIDFNLPRASGGQILPVIKSTEAFSEIPVYFITGHTKDEVLPLLNHVKFDGILTKSDTLIQEIAQVLDKIN